MRITESQHRRIRAQLVLAGMKKFELAERICTPPTTLSERLHGRRDAPDDFLEQIERALDVPCGALAGDSLPGRRIGR